jgi:hypothetical protein
MAIVAKDGNHPASVIGLLVLGADVWEQYRD